MSTASEPTTAALTTSGSIPAPPPPVVAETGEPPHWPITIEFYGRMIAAGVFHGSDRTYLWKGRLAAKMTKYRPHCIATKNTYDGLMALRLAGCSVEQESPMAFRFQASVPEPDVKVVRGRSEDYSRGFVTTADVPLVVEVSESTLDVDRKKALAYAAEGVPVYWLVNLPGRRVEVFTEPAEGAYTRCTPFAEDQEVPVVLDGREAGRLRVRAILPPTE